MASNWIHWCLAKEAACELKAAYTFLDAPSHLHKRVCPSVRPSVRNACSQTSARRNSRESSALFSLKNSFHKNMKA